MIRDLIKATCRRHGKEGYMGAALALVGQMKNKELLRVGDLRQLQEWVPPIIVALARGLAISRGLPRLPAGQALADVEEGKVSGPAGIRAIERGLLEMDRVAERAESGKPEKERRSHTRDAMRYGPGEVDTK